jgi:hypothetical protein
MHLCSHFAFYLSPLEYLFQYLNSWKPLNESGCQRRSSASLELPLDGRMMPRLQKRELQSILNHSNIIIHHNKFIWIM